MCDARYLADLSRWAGGRRDPDGSKRFQWRHSIIHHRLPIAAITRTRAPTFHSLSHRLYELLLRPTAVAAAVAATSPPSRGNGNK